MGLADIEFFGRAQVRIAGTGPSHKVSGLGMRDVFFMARVFENQETRVSKFCG